MLILFSIFLFIVGIYSSYKYSKVLRKCVTYSKEQQLDMLGLEATSEVALMSNILFFFRLLKINDGTNIQDLEQRKLLELSRKELLMALGFCFLGVAALVVIGAIAR